MRVLLVNVCSGCLSTGKIAAQIASDYIAQGHEAVVAYGRSYKDVGVPTYKIGTKVDVMIHATTSRLMDCAGFGSKRATKKFLEWADNYNPDIVWLHNIHGYYLDCEQLFQWIKSRPDMKVYWTLHDCWSFTGHCAYFTDAQCEKWKAECHDCPLLNEYPQTFLDRSRANYAKKRKCFTGVKDMTLITPSQWLADLAKQSFLQEYDVEVRYNTIDKELFQPTPSDVRVVLHATNRVMILGVASMWDRRKGLQDFLELSKKLDDRYLIVLVGVNDDNIRQLKAEREVETYHYEGDRLVSDSDTVSTRDGDHADEFQNALAQIDLDVAIKPEVNELYYRLTGASFHEFPKRMADVVCIGRTSSPVELAKLYTAADVFVNPTHNDNYPTVNLEAQACGTGIITYDVGGCKETIHNI